MTGVLPGEVAEAQSHRGEGYVEIRGGDQSNAASGQGTPRAAGNTRSLEEARKEPSR